MTWRVRETHDRGEWVAVVVTEDGERETLALERTDEARSISPGDTLWWQGAYAFWTPNGAPFTDRPLERVRPRAPRVKGGVSFPMIVRHPHE